MHLRGRGGHAVKRKVQRGEGVLVGGGLLAEVMGSAGGGIDAHVAHRIRFLIAHAVTRKGFACKTRRAITRGEWKSRIAAR